MSEIVYGEKSQYTSKVELCKAIEDAVIKINLNYSDAIQKLSNSMPGRCLKVIENKGAIIDN